MDRPRLGWIDGVRVALRGGGMTVRDALRCVKDHKKWRSLFQVYVVENQNMFAWHLCSFQAVLPTWGSLLREAFVRAIA